MQRWTIHLEGGPRRVNHAAVAIGEHIFSFSGYCTGEDYETTRPMDVHILNTINYRWRVLPNVPSDDKQYRNVPYQRYGHTAVVVGECAYIWGGRNDKDGACNVLFCFDSTSCTWTRPAVQGRIPGARDGHSACVINNKMYIFGGYEEEIEQFSNEVHALDFTTMTWSLIQSMGEPASWRDFHSATGINGKMYIFGGRSDRGGPTHTNHEIYCNKIKVFDTHTCHWEEPPTSGIVPSGRRSHSAFVYNGQLYVFGGYNGLYDVHFEDLHKFNPDTNEWSPVTVKGKGPCRRRRQCCCVIRDRVFLFGGTSPSSTNKENSYGLIDQSDLHVLDLAPSLRTICLLAVLNYKLDGSYLPRILLGELKCMTTNNKISRPLNNSG